MLSSWLIQGIYSSAPRCELQSTRFFFDRVQPALQSDPFFYKCFEALLFFAESELPCER